MWKLTSLSPSGFEDVKMNAEASLADDFKKEHSILKLV